jgi:stage II sporulation protein M
MKHYFIVSALIFVVGIYLGHKSPEQFQFIFNGQKERIQDLWNSVQGGSNEQLSIFLLILKNNVIAVAVVILLGVFFMVVPIYFLLTNGAMLGNLYGAAVERHEIGLFFKGILPHGVIEIPALIIAAAFGIRFGVVAAKCMIAMPYEPARKRAGVQMVTFIKVLVPACGLLMVLLVIAAVLESTVTYGLVGK